MEDKSTMEAVQTENYNKLALVEEMSDEIPENTSIIEQEAIDRRVNVMKSVETLVNVGFVSESMENESNISDQSVMVTQRMRKNPRIVAREQVKSLQCNTSCW